MLSFCLSLSFECSLWTLDLSPACHGQLEPHEILGEIVMFGGLLLKLCPASPARWAFPTCCILSLVSVIIGTVRPPLPQCCPDAKARHALHEQLRGSASLVSNPPSDLPPGIPCTWNSRDLDLEMGNVKITRTGRGNVAEKDVQVTWSMTIPWTSIQTLKQNLRMISTCVVI